jgi:hypothetical protein
MRGSGKTLELTPVDPSRLTAYGVPARGLVSGHWS